MDNPIKLNDIFESEKIVISHLAVLKAAVENNNLGSHFGSWLNLKNWINETINFGLINEKGKPTKLGKKIYNEIRLNGARVSIAYMWPDVQELEKKANEIRSKFLEKRKEIDS